MLTLHITLKEHDGQHTYTWPNKQWRTRRGVENFRDKLIREYGYDPAQFTITGTEERRPDDRIDPKGKVKVGDIFHASWGYDMTINDFYEVTALSPTGKTCTLRHLCMTTISGSPYAPGGALVRPATGEHRFRGKPLMRKHVNARNWSHGTGVYINVDESRTAFLMSERDLTCEGFYENHLD